MMNSLLSAFLYPLSFPYGLLVKLDRRLSQAHDLGRPVISVGNITWGGTGKTPVVIHLARALLRQGKKVAVLTRGYGRKDAGNYVVVSDGREVLAGPEAAGDEPVLLARNVPDAFIIAGADRRQTAVVALERFSPDVFVLDDGFQHWSAGRDLDIVCINAANPFGNGRLIPSGSLREPLEALGRAGIILLTNAETVDEERLLAVEKVLERYSGVPRLRTGRQTVALRPINGEGIVARAAFKGKEVVAFSAIGENSGFAKTLEQSGFSVLRHFAFRDHHWYSSGEIRTMLDSAPDQRILVTTTKDAVRLSALLKGFPEQEARRFFALETELYFMNGEEQWENQIRKAVRSS